MKTMRSVGLANWMLTHCTFGCYDESLIGDLLEELRAGRSVVWYWRQVISAIAVAVSNRSRAYVAPLMFSAGWSMLYSALWPFLLDSRAVHRIVHRMTAYDLPFSTAWSGVGALAPVVLFIWIGFFVYRAVFDPMGSKSGTMRVLGSLSISLNVLLVICIGQHLQGSGIDLSKVSRENSNSHLFALTIPIVLSLFSALVCASQRERRSIARVG
jgi:hypothetical protein